MITTKSMRTADFNDAELVAESLNGNRDAFRQIVERYQTLISSLAYCATGSVSQSEDLAQEAFVTAWKKLAELREPAKLRLWLCGITRFLISKEFRRQGREPAHAAESLEALDECVSPEPLPPDQVISEEEKAILWRSLERIPEIYREPLVLFYRHHQSIEAVAHDLELSEDAVKQRLSRGRKLLQEQFLGFVAGALKHTTPGETFTLGVLAALPLLATTATAATATLTATKGGAMAKTTGMGTCSQTILKAISAYLGAFIPIMLLGGYIGFKMGGDARQSPRQRDSVATFWRIMVGNLVAFVALPILLLLVLATIVDLSGDLRERLLGGITIWLGLMYAVVPAALMLWALRRRRKFQLQTSAAAATTTGNGKKKRLVPWVVIAMIGTACLLGFLISDSHRNVQHISAVEVQKMVAAGKGKEANFSVMQLQNGHRYFWIVLGEGGKRTYFTAPVDDATLAVLKEYGIKCPTCVQGRDFEVFGWPGKLLVPFCIFILAIGAVVLLRKPGKFNPREMDAQQTRRMQQMEKVANKVFGTGVALVLIAAAILLGFLTRWQDRSLSGAEARQLIAASRNVHCEVFQYNDGTKELWITLNGSRHYPSHIAPADAPTLALLAKQRIPYRILIQGRDFGLRHVNRWVSLLCISMLTAGAAFALRWAWKKDRRFQAPESSPNC